MEKNGTKNIKNIRTNVKNPIFIFILIAVMASILFLPIFSGKVNLNGNRLVSFYDLYAQNLSFKNHGGDQLRIYFPFYKITFDQFKNFEIPYWNPYAFSGHPHLADFQTAVFYPINIFGLFLPQIEFWHVLRISGLLLGTFFTFLYLRTLKLSKIPSFFGAITFGFSPYMITWGSEVVMSPHSIIWLPLILYSIEKYLNQYHKIFLVIIALSSMFTLLAGYMQTTIYLFIFTFAYLIFRIGKDNLLNKKSILLFGAILFGGLLSAIQLIPSGEIYFNSARSKILLTENLIGFLVPLEGLLTFIAPDFFGNPSTHNFFRKSVAQYYESIMFVGIASLIFASSTLFLKKIDFSRFKAPIDFKFIIFIFVIGVVSLSTVLDIVTSKIFLSLPIPFLSSSITNRILFIPAFCISILAAIGMQAYLNSNLKIYRVIKWFSIIYFVILFIVLYSRFFEAGFAYKYLFETIEYEIIHNINIALRNLVIPLVVFSLSSGLIILGNKFRKLKPYILVIIVSIAFMHIVRFNYKYLSFNEMRVIFPKNQIISYIQDNQEYFRSWTVGQNFFENNFASQYSIFWPEGFDSLNNIRYAQFTNIMQGGDLSEFKARADAGIGRSDVEELVGKKGNAEESLPKLKRRRLINLLGIKFVAASLEDSEVLENNNFVKLFEETSKDTGEINALFENTLVHPRTQLISNYEIHEADESIINNISSLDFDFRNNIILENDPQIITQSGQGESQIVSYKPNEVVIKTKSDVPKILLLTDNHYPGWKATVDGDETNVIRANYTFRAVPLEAGEHIVRFYIVSDSFKYGAIITILSILTLSFLYFRKNRFLD